MRTPSFADHWREWLKTASCASTEGGPLEWSAAERNVAHAFYVMGLRDGIARRTICARVCLSPIGKALSARWQNGKQTDTARTVM